MSITLQVPDPSTAFPHPSTTAVAWRSKVMQGKDLRPSKPLRLPSEPAQLKRVHEPARLSGGSSFAAHRRQLVRSPADRHTLDVCHTAGSPPSRAALSSFRSKSSTRQHVPQCQQVPHRPPLPTPVSPPPRLILSAFGNERLRRKPPCSAPVSRLARTASRRGISIDPSLGKNTLKVELTRPRSSTRFDASTSTTQSNFLSVPTITTSGTTSATTPLTPMSSPNFRRGLTLAIMDSDGHIVAESAPVTPRGVATDNGDSPQKAAGSLETKLNSSPTPDRTSPVPPAQREIILCRYYHTPGLTCTSSPCRFVHSLDGISFRGAPLRNGSSSSSINHVYANNKADSSGTSPGTSLADAPNSSDSSAQLSAAPGTPAQSPDPTRGTFARAQAAHPLRELRLDSEALAHFQSGDPITLTDTEGKEVTGYVFKLSGGGKGAGGLKSRAKFKTVPCRDFAEGHCAYGDYCSFIHDRERLYDPLIHGKKETPSSSSPSATTTPAMSDIPGSDSSASSNALLATPIDISPLVPQAVSNHSAAIPMTTTTDLAPIDGKQVAMVNHNATISPSQPLAMVSTSLSTSAATSSDAASHQPTIDGAAFMPPSVSGQDVYTMSPTGYSDGLNSATWVEWNPTWLQGSWTPHQPIPQGPWPMQVPLVNGVPVNHVQHLPTSSSGPLVQQGARESSVVWTPSGWQVTDTAQLHPERGFWRTKPCRLYAQGVCPHGDNCSFLHTTATPPRHAKPALPRASKTTPCKWFNSATGCDQGEACSFKHVQVIPTEQQRAVPRPWRTQPCRHYQVGRCYQGDACHFAHVIAPVSPRSPSASVSGSQFSRSGSHDSPRIARSLASSQASRNSAIWLDSDGSSQKSDLSPPTSPVGAQTPVLAALTGEKETPGPSTSTQAQSVAPRIPAHPISHRRASAPPNLPDSLVPSRDRFFADGQSTADTPQGAVELCADWLTTGRCQRENCSFAHTPASPLTEEHLSKACAELRLMKRYDDNSDTDDDDDDDDVEFVTVATHTTHSPTAMSARFISTNSL